MASNLPVRVVNDSSSPIPVNIGIYEQVGADTTTAYTVLAGDWGKLRTFSNASAVAVTLPQANSTTFPNGWFIDVANLGVGAVTITPTTSTIHDGVTAAATLVLTTGKSGRIVSNGTNYFFVAGASLVNGSAASASAGAVTHAKRAGVITSEALTTAAGADYTLTITNSLVKATDMVFASVANGTNTVAGLKVCRVQPANGSIVILVRNIHATDALDGTIKISYEVKSFA